MEPRSKRLLQKTLVAASLHQSCCPCAQQDAGSDTEVALTNQWKAKVLRCMEPRSRRLLQKTLVAASVCWPCCPCVQQDAGAATEVALTTQ